LANSISEQKLLPGTNGGNIYDFQAAMALGSKNELFADPRSIWEKDTPLSYWLKLRKRPSADLLIMEPYPVVFGSLRKGIKRLAIIHHIDFDRIESSRKHKWFFSRLIKRLKTLDGLVTVSKYWKDYLESEGCTNVSVIYNSFDPLLYQFAEDKRVEFRSKFGFDPEKPLVHIGNASAEKGVYEVYEALKGEPIQMVMSGGRNNASDLPVAFMSLPETEYRELIFSCDAVMAFSKMMEGWNRIVHEAMLCQVPVIGSGSGGMQELLEGGGQLITSNASDLPDLLRQALDNRTVLGKRGYSYASQFNLGYFKAAWLDFVQSI